MRRVSLYLATAVTAVALLSDSCTAKPGQTPKPEHGPSITTEVCKPGKIDRITDENGGVRVFFKVKTCSRDESVWFTSQEWLNTACQPTWHGKERYYPQCVDENPFSND